MLAAAIRGLSLITVIAAVAGAQGLDDGVMMPRTALAAGFMYGHDSWNEYWEGTRKRTNENIGTLTTQTVTFSANYGVTERFGVMAILPYVWTNATQGNLRGRSDLQDLTVAAKYQLLSTPFTQRGTLSAMLVAAAAAPVSDYDPDFLPLSIGSASRRFTGRFNLHFQSNGFWFIGGSAGHTWRNKVTLDRDSYYTDGQLYLSNEVAMPRVFDYVLSAGYRRSRFTLPVSLTEQRTLGGGDMRRQDMPFVSDRMNFTRLNIGAAYALDVRAAPTLRFGLSRVLGGRNVGQSTTVTGGAVYTFSF